MKQFSLKKVISLIILLIVIWLAFIYFSKQRTLPPPPEVKTTPTEENIASTQVEEKDISSIISAPKKDPFAPLEENIVSSTLPLSQQSIKLQAVYISPKGKIAVINDTFYSEGETINNCIIENITPQEVSLSSIRGELKTIHLGE